MIRRPGRQRGDILLFTLVLLLLLLLGALVAMREGLTNTWMNGNTLVRQKNVHVSDAALRMVEQTVGVASGSLPLELAATGQQWYRDVAPNTPPPSDSYWDSCASSSTASTRCATLNVTVGSSTVPYTVTYLVQPTGRMDKTCKFPTAYDAHYYDVFIHVKETSGSTAANTESIIRLCTHV
jgi:Tfp pilus assembly protein PilX